MLLLQDILYPPRNQRMFPEKGPFFLVQVTNLIFQPINFSIFREHMLVFRVGNSYIISDD